jgi:hypothetical protein
MIKVLILKHHPNTYLIGKLTELDEEPGLLLEESHVIDTEGGVHVYPLHTDQRFIFLTTTDIMTIMDAAPAVLAAYQKAVNE